MAAGRLRGFFGRLWLAGLMVFTVRWLETVAIDVFAYRHSGSAFLVAPMTLLRRLAIGLFGAFIGARAEKIERRITPILVVMLMLASSCCLMLLCGGGHLAIWQVSWPAWLGHPTIR